MPTISQSRAMYFACTCGWSGEPMFHLASSVRVNRGPAMAVLLVGGLVVYCVGSWLS